MPSDGHRSDGGGSGDGGIADAAPDACVPFPESCDGMDNDCDGIIDEGFNLDMDPANCGACGVRCDEPNTAGTCSKDQGAATATCHYTCLPGFVDTDNNVADGCEYFCTPTNGGVETCDFADNDCDTFIDEGLNLETDVNNCGSCGNQCLALHATPTCAPDPVTGVGTCGFGACDPGYADISPAISGCEYQCPVFPTTAELCNGIDDDCDGNVDEQPIAGEGNACFDPSVPVADQGVGRCTAGTEACSFGVPVCTGFGTPLANDALCNNIDDDCDGRVDEDVNEVSDPRTCGGCLSCDQLHPNSNAIFGCANSLCTIVDCLPGFVDADGNPNNGCEYACTPTGPETCDGVDNDCDGRVDEDLVAPTNFCHTLGACAGTTPTCAADACTGQKTWTCEYGPDAEVDSCGNLLLQEAKCDEIDGDCDGRVDETFTQKGTSCKDNGVGECQRSGTEVCNSTHDGLTCNLTSPVVTPQPEICDDKDNDCDGTIDEQAPDTMVPVQNGATTFYIYEWEASKPDATAVNHGNTTTRSCSKPGVLPWSNVTQTEAAAACAAAGKRLCTETEWQAACAGPSSLKYPYGNTYQPTFCNGRDVDLDCTPPDSDQVATTGRGFQCPTPGASQCVAATGAVDMSGNLEEWTSTPVSSAFRVKGGAYDTIKQGLTCDFSFIAFSPDTAFPNLGFRCCADQPDPP